MRLGWGRTAGPGSVGGEEGEEAEEAEEGEGAEGAGGDGPRRAVGEGGVGRA